ncbi:MarR family winged helix-turn-helix transcriptional regulator [Paraclostridium sordellii]|uniref:MarR family winged helix-turn-helix transcriptional regulator n=1 Tax=Paraclostridium sordellii TaxID=1505 RepID=UPI001C61170D|nr:MarR family transcriptional regulator [Paeniclostridium sordellii]QYE99023.1 MarR family transcriptional regulator [Paeniclostridium sordellii]
MNRKIEIIACEIENLITQIEEKQYSHNEEQFRQLLKENEIINFNQISITECHVISTIASIEKANGIAIAEKLRMTRGGISKIATRLMEKNLITTYKDESNQKKVFYTLTPLGEKVNIIHNQLHKENHKSLCNIASSYTLQEQDIILRFIKDLQNNNIKDSI